MSEALTRGATGASSQDLFEQLGGDRSGGSAPENYERYFVPVLSRPLAADLIERAALHPGERVLDVACGTGIVARLAAERVGPTGTVAGVDINAGMLAVARSVTPPAAGIAWHEASAEALPFPEAAFDAVLCQLGLQFLPDRLAALREMRRVLTPGGRLLFNVPGPTPRGFAILADALARHIKPELAAFMYQVFSLHDPGEIRALLGEAGLHDVAVQSERVTFRLPAPAAFLWQYVQSTPLAALVAQADADHREALERDVVAGWQTYVEEGVLRLPVDMVTATARA